MSLFTFSPVWPLVEYLAKNTGTSKFNSYLLFITFMMFNTIMLPQLLNVHVVFAYEYYFC